MEKVYFFITLLKFNYSSLDIADIENIKDYFIYIKIHQLL